LASTYPVVVWSAAPVVFHAFVEDRMLADSHTFDLPSTPSRHPRHPLNYATYATSPSLPLSLSRANLPNSQANKKSFLVNPGGAISGGTLLSVLAFDVDVEVEVEGGVEDGVDVGEDEDEDVDVGDEARGRRGACVCVEMRTRMDDIMGWGWMRRVGWCFSTGGGRWEAVRTAQDPKKREREREETRTS
jgi:hypothetical protein